MFHDTIPEEREEQHKKLIALLRRGLRKPVSLSSPEQSQIIERVRERLGQTEVGTDVSRPRADSNTAGNPEADAIHRSLPSGRIQNQSSRRGHLPRFVNGLVAVLIVGILIGAALLLFRPSLRQDAAPPPPIDSSGPAARTQVNGLQATIHLVTPGPYFLSELVAVDVSLTNHTHTPYMMGGLRKVDMACSFSALSVQITGGTAPFYTLPTLDVGCFQPMFLTTVEPNQTLTLHYDLPITKSGEVTMTMGGMYAVPQTGPLTGHWPSLRIQVDAQIPANRAISLHNSGTQVIIQAPPAARTHLLYRETISCDGYLGAGEGLADWSPLSKTVLSQPACPTAPKHWKYIVSAPGYSIAAGKRDS